MTDSFKKEETEPDIFDSNQLTIVSWTLHLIDNIEDKVLRGLIWKNILFHLVGRHENCMHGQLPENHIE